MPAIVKIGDEEIYIKPFNPTRLFKRKAGQSRNEVLIYDGGIGNFIDILNQNDLLIAKTEEGWFFSKTKGESWFSEEEAKEYDLSLSQKFKGEVTFKTSIIKNYVNDESKFKNTFEFNVEERVNATNHHCLELIELENDATLKDFIDHCLKMKDMTGDKKAFIFSTDHTDFIQKRLFDHYFGSDKFVRKRMLQHVPQSFYFMPDFGVEELRNFEYNIMRSKRAYDTKLFIIDDFMLFFKKEKGLDFIESVLRIICHIASLYGIRVMATYSKCSQNLDTASQDFISTFKHDLIDHFTQVQSEENELLIREK